MTATYNYGYQVQITATAPVGWTFAGWTGVTVSKANQITITMDGRKTVTVTFVPSMALPEYPLGALAALGSCLSA